MTCTLADSRQQGAALRNGRLAVGALVGFLYFTDAQKAAGPFYHSPCLLLQERLARVNQRSPEM